MSLWHAGRFFLDDGRQTIGSGMQPLPSVVGGPSSQVWEVHLPKTRSEKQAELKELTEALSQAQVVILTEYRGLQVSDINKIRGQLRAKGTTFSVAKNTL